MSTIRYASPQGRWVIATAALGSGVAFLDGTVVNTALPSIRRDLRTTLAGQQWVLTGYLLTLGSLLVLGGSLGDRYGRRRVFQIGLAGFALSSALCGLAPGIGLLIAARILQGVAAAALVPGSLAMLSAVFVPGDRARAIGAWTGLASVSTALGPFVGGWLIDAVSWRLVFLINLPIAAAAIGIAQRHVPETDAGEPRPSADATGALLLAAGLGAIVHALIAGPRDGWTPSTTLIGGVGVACIIGFVVVESVVAQPMVPLHLFRSRHFSGANVTTFVVWGAMGAVFFLLAVHLQQDLGYSALEAGAATMPITVLMLLFASRGGALAQRVGPRFPMTVGPLVIAIGCALLARVHDGVDYGTGVLPGVVVFGLGLVVTVAPLTATVLAAVDDRQAGLGSAVNNAVARIAALLAVAVLPAAAGIHDGAGELAEGFATAMRVCAALATVGSISSFVMIRVSRRGTSMAR